MGLRADRLRGTGGEKEKRGEQRGLLSEGNDGDKKDARMGGEKNKHKREKDE